MAKELPQQFSESAWARGRRDCKRVFHDWRFLVIELVGSPVIGVLTSNAWVAVYFAVGILAAVWIGATASAPVRQRNEARREIMAHSGAGATHDIERRIGEWPSLTQNQSNKLINLLRNRDRHPLYIACQGSDCAHLALSFREVFQELQWPLQVGDGGIDGSGVNGIMIHPDDEVARMLKEAIEQSTGHSIILGLPRDDGATHPNMLVVGARPFF